MISQQMPLSVVLNQAEFTKCHISSSKLRWGSRARGRVSCSTFNVRVGNLSFLIFMLLFLSYSWGFPRASFCCAASLPTLKLIITLTHNCSLKYLIFFLNLLFHLLTSREGSIHSRQFAEVNSLVCCAPDRTQVIRLVVSAFAPETSPGKSEKYLIADREEFSSKENRSYKVRISGIRES